MSNNGKDFNWLENIGLLAVCIVSVLVTTGSLYIGSNLYYTYKYTQCLDKAIHSMNNVEIVQCRLK
jgi:hypothetical protein